MDNEIGFVCVVTCFKPQAPSVTGLHGCKPLEHQHFTGGSARGGVRYTMALSSWACLFQDTRA